MSVGALRVLAAAVSLVAAPALAHTPTHTFGPSPTATPTGTPPPPQAAIAARPNPARAEQRVVLDGSASLRAGGCRSTAASKFSKGEGLGPVGARFVAEVILGLLELDPRSFLGSNRNWSPLDDKVGANGVTSLFQLLTA